MTSFDVFVDAGSEPPLPKTVFGGFRTTECGDSITDKDSNLHQNKL